MATRLKTLRPVLVLVRYMIFSFLCSLNKYAHYETRKRQIEIKNKYTSLRVGVFLGRFVLGCARESRRRVDDYDLGAGGLYTNSNTWLALFVRSRESNRTAMKSLHGRLYETCFAVR
jgi:hypothetical protein